MSPRTESYYKPQIPRDFRDDRTVREKRYDQGMADRKRYEDESRYLEREKARYPDDLRYGSSSGSSSKWYPEGKKIVVVDKSKLEGRNYRKELLERFTDMDLEDSHEFPSQQRYYE